MAICANKLMKLQRISEIRSNHYGNSESELFMLRVPESLKSSFQVLLSSGERSLARVFLFVCRQRIGVPFIDLKSVVGTISRECSKSVGQDILHRPRQLQPPAPFTSLTPTFTAELPSHPNGSVRYRKRQTRTLGRFSHRHHLPRPLNGE